MEIRVHNFLKLVGSIVNKMKKKFSLIFPKNVQDNYIKEQLYFPAVGTIKETDGLLKDLIRSALSLVIHSICKFKTF